MNANRNKSLRSVLRYPAALAMVMGMGTAALAQGSIAVGAANDPTSIDAGDERAPRTGTIVQNDPSPTGPASDSAALDLALAKQREALKAIRASDPLRWAAAQDQLARALMELSERDRGTVRLEQAVVAYREVLEEWTRERAPKQWAESQGNLGFALEQLAWRESGTTHLEEAVAAYREALKEETTLPPSMGRTNVLYHLATALNLLGQRTGDTSRFEEAVTSSRAALKLRPGLIDSRWIDIQMTLGDSLTALGIRESGSTRLAEAVGAYREAAAKLVVQPAPIVRASLYNKLGLALEIMGEREGGTSRLEEALTSFDSAVQAFAAFHQPWNEDLRLHWTFIRNNQANALARLGERESGNAHLEAAIAAYRDALKQQTGERAPHEWAAAQNGLGVALLRLGERASDDVRLEEAVAAFAEALKVRTRERAPLDWATSLGNQGVAMMHLAQRSNDAARAEAAYQQITTAIDTMRTSDHVSSAADLERRLPTARDIRDRLNGRSAVP